jgi:hypothetical protein
MCTWLEKWQRPRRAVLRSVDQTPLLPNPQTFPSQEAQTGDGCVGPVPFYAARTKDLGPGDFVKIHPGVPEHGTAGDGIPHPAWAGTLR